MARIAPVLALSMFLTLLAASTTASGAGRAFPGNSGEIAFVNDRTGTPSIYAIESDGSLMRRIVPNEPQGQYPAWSTGGKVVLFTVPVSGGPNPTYELWAMSAAGTGARRLLKESSSSVPMAAAWAPNAKSIVFYMDDSLWVAKANGSNARRLTVASFSDGSPSWSRGGRIAFDRDENIWSIGAGGDRVRRLGEGSTPSWAPNGRRLVFSAYPKNGNATDIYVMKADGSGRRPLTSTPGVSETQPVWSPDGRLIAYSADDGLYVMNANGTKSRFVARKGWQASWSKRSRELVYARKTARWDGLVFRADIKSARKQQLLNPKLDANPQWSPEGDRLAFSRDGIVHIVGADGFDLHSLKLKGSDPAWSPDGTLVAVSAKLRLIIAAVGAEDRTRFSLGLDPEIYESVSNPDWSPDGSTIALVANTVSGDHDIFKVSVTEDTVASKLPVGCASATSPTWSPSADLLGLSCDQSIAVFSTVTNDLVPIASGTDADLAWSPDGSQIVFAELTGDSESNRELFVVNADGSALSQLTGGPGSSTAPDWQPTS